MFNNNQKTDFKHKITKENVMKMKLLLYEKVTKNNNKMSSKTKITSSWKNCKFFLFTYV